MSVTIISLLATLISGAVFIFSLAVSEMPRKAIVGEVYATYNAGIGDNPNEAPRPFVSLFKVLESKGDKIKVKWIWVDINGDALSVEKWESAYGFGRFKELVIDPSKEKP